MDWDQKNARRLELIDKKHRQGLDPAEQAEFQHLQEECFAELEARSPRPALEPVLDRLEARLNAC